MMRNYAQSCVMRVHACVMRVYYVSCVFLRVSCVPAYSCVVMRTVHTLPSDHTMIALTKHKEKKGSNAILPGYYTNGTSKQKITQVATTPRPCLPRYASLIFILPFGSVKLKVHIEKKQYRFVCIMNLMIGLDASLQATPTSNEGIIKYDNFYN